jgi:Cu2+-exporting ATPase
MAPRSSASSKAVAVCRHCSAPIVDARDDGFCCVGCAEVSRLLAGAGLERYYDLGGGKGYPVVATEPDRKWLEGVASRLARGKGSQRLVLDVQGVHCAACVWLFERLFERLTKRGRIVVNPAVGSVELVVAEDFPLARFVADVEAFGYRFGPATKSESARQSDLVWRMGVCIAIAMNTMIFGFAIYCGLEPGRVQRVFHGLDFGLSLVSVLVGGTVFFRSAWQALRRRVLHLDLPIALGIALVFASSTYTYASRGGATSYFDTLNVFIALMLVGRFLQERVLAKNRALLLANDGADGILTRRIDRSGAVALVRCTEIAAGDRLLLGHGDIVPVTATLVGDEAAVFSLDWISGESAPRTFEPGTSVPAGAFSRGDRAVEVRAEGAFESSALVSLLRTDSRRDADLARATSWHVRLTRVYVVSVLAVAAVAFVGWLVTTNDLARTLDVVAAVLIVTCPCAFGIATPLAYELAQGALRRVGLFVRTPGFLDRATEVERVVFDKTGTLTTGRLVVENEDAIRSLDRADRERLFAAAIRSSHPKSRAIAETCQRLEPARFDAFDAHADVREIVGKGLELRERGRVYRLGARAWALGPADVPSIAAGTGDVLFTVDGVVLAALRIAEELRPDARAEIAELQQAGYEVFVLSGDGPRKTREMARACGVPEAHAYGGRSPESKAAWLDASRSGKALFVGDGINDSLVAEAAFCAGTPAIDRPFMASRSDFYFVTAGLRPIREALAMSKRLERVVRRNLAVALFYNAVTLVLALSGRMTPLVCAVLMPISSLSTVLSTTAQLSLGEGRSPRSR